MKIIYLGTPEFAVAPLKAIINSGVFVVNHENKFALNLRPYIFKEKKNRQRVLSIR